MNQDTIGFTMLTYRDEALVRRTCRTLSALFGGAPVAIHHQFQRCPFRREAFPCNVRFVENPYLITWGNIFHVHATISALRLLYQDGQGPDWFYLLSNFCYPLKPAAEMARALRAGGADAYLECVPVGPEHINTLFERESYHRYFRHWHVPIALARYCRFILRVPKWGWLFRKQSIYSPDFRCYAGSEFFSANREVALYLLNHYDHHPELLRHYTHTYIPSESYYATLLLNSGRFRICSDGLRFFDRSGKLPFSTSRTKVLDETYFDRLVRSHGHFARKVYSDRSARLLDMLDEHLGVSGR